MEVAHNGRRIGTPDQLGVQALEKQAKDLGLGLPTEARRAKDSAVREIGIYNSLRTAINAAKF